jgi:hypothetical protein
MFPLADDGSWWICVRSCLTRCYVWGSISYEILVADTREVGGIVRHVTALTDERVLSEKAWL